MCECISERVCESVCVSSWNGWVTHRSDERVSVSGCEFDQLVIWLVSVLVSGCVSAWDGWVAHSVCLLVAKFVSYILYLVAKMLLKSLQEAVVMCATCPSCKKNPHLAAALSLARAYAEKIREQQSQKQVTQEPEDWEDLI